MLPIVGVVKYNVEAGIGDSLANARYIIPVGDQISDALTKRMARLAMQDVDFVSCL